MHFPGFGRGGVVVTGVGAEARPIALLLRPDRRIVVVGRTADALALARFLRDGRLDASFGRGGTVITPTPAVDWRSASRAPDGKIVVAGARVSNGPPQTMALASRVTAPTGSSTARSRGMV